LGRKNKDTMLARTDWWSGRWRNEKVKKKREKKPDREKEAIYICVEYRSEQSPSSSSWKTDAHARTLRQRTMHTLASGLLLGETQPPLLFYRWWRRSREMGWVHAVYWWAGKTSKGFDDWPQTTAGLVFVSTANDRFARVIKSINSNLWRKLYYWFLQTVYEQPCCLWAWFWLLIAQLLSGERNAREISSEFSYKFHINNSIPVWFDIFPNTSHRHSHWMAARSVLIHRRWYKIFFQFSCPNKYWLTKEYLLQLNDKSPLCINGFSIQMHDPS
jgi:hypothetical protein